jgi:hypothetical protein
MIFLSDLLDRRGRVRSSGHDVVEFLLSIVPAIVASVLPVYGPVAGALRAVPGAARIIHIAVPLFLLGLAVHVIVSRRQEQAPPSMHPGAPPPAWIYAHTRARRVAAKVMLLVLVPLAFAELRDKLPNRLLGRTGVHAYVCNASGEQSPVAAIVVVRDSFGNPVGGPMQADDEGYVSLVLSPWGQRPVSVAVTPPCSALTAAVHTERSKSGCGGTSAPLPPGRPPSFVWKVTCSP